MKWAFPFLVLCLFCLGSCSSGNSSDIPTSLADTSEVSEEPTLAAMPEIQRDLADIQQGGVLKVITMYSSTNYFLYRGQPMGYEYELIQRLAEDLDLRIELVMARSIPELVEKLKNGEGDLIAAGLTITNERKNYLKFTEFLYLTKQVLVQRKPDHWRRMKLHEIENRLIRDPIELLNDTVYVRKNSSYNIRLNNLKEEMGGEIYILPAPDMDTEKLIAKVAEGKIKYTVADRNLAVVNAAYYGNLDVKTPLSFSQRIAWAVRKTSPHLLDTINDWIGFMKKRNDYYAIYDKYYKSTRSMKRKVESEFYGEKTGKISPYDKIIKENAESIGWDWRLISSLVYQESQFNPKAHSWTKASGLMQIMPSTAMELGVTNVHDPQENVRAGVKYLKQLWEEWDSIADSTERVKFTIASYNCGIHHVFDARKLAKREGMNPNLWEENVETQLLNLSYPKYYRDPDVMYGYVRGKEPVNYVREIFERYEHYKRFIPE